MQLKFQFPKATRLPKEEVVQAAREIKTVRQLMPGPSGPHQIHPPDDPWESIGYNKRRA